MQQKYSTCESYYTYTIVIFFYSLKAISCVHRTKISRKAFELFIYLRTCHLAVILFVICVCDRREQNCRFQQVSPNVPTWNNDRRALQSTSAISVHSYIFLKLFKYAYVPKISSNKSQNLTNSISFYGQHCKHLSLADGGEKLSLPTSTLCLMAKKSSRNIEELGDTLTCSTNI